MGVGNQRHILAGLVLGKRSDIHCIGGWMGLGVNLDRHGKSRSTGVRIPDHSAHRK